MRTYLELCGNPGGWDLEIGALLLGLALGLVCGFIFGRLTA